MLTSNPVNGTSPESYRGNTVLKTLAALPFPLYGVCSLSHSQLGPRKSKRRPKQCPQYPDPV